MTEEKKTNVTDVNDAVAPWLNTADSTPSIVAPGADREPDVDLSADQQRRAQARQRHRLATDFADRWVLERGQQLRRLRRRIPVIDDLLPQAIAALVVYIRASNPGYGESAVRSAVFGLTFGIDADLRLGEPVDRFGTVDPRSLLYAVLDCAHELNDAGVSEALGAHNRVSSLSEPEMIAFWDAVRAVTRPTQTPADSGSKWFAPEEETVVHTPLESGTLPELLTGLDAMRGLTRVKELVRAETAALKVAARRTEMGLRNPTRNRHMVFQGNPGTGKTTLARTFASIYTALGISDATTMVETDRSGLVAQWLGKTALRTSKVIDEALGGVLFIDEAYALAGHEDSGADRFAHEALDTLVKRMEDDRDDLVVILAGYPDEMAFLLDMNPGLGSRIGITVDFPDYSDEELVKILRDMFTENDYDITRAALDVVGSRLASVKRGKSFGNARLMRNLFEATVRAQAVRVADGLVGEPLVGRLRRVTVRDVEEAQSEVLPLSEKGPAVGFG